MKSISDDHKKLRRQPLLCAFMRPVLSSKEYYDLQMYGSWLNGLYTGAIMPESDAQVEFISAVNSTHQPTEYFALLFWRYLKRKQIMNDQGLNDIKTTLQDDREDWKKIRRMRF